ncbi:MAG: hypothetical protein BGO96_06170 [Micrococcales bacterium 73-15]|nr:MAG: hypothetical protein BGO96_06170 [Micrococcales bacterium 73-15]
MRAMSTPKYVTIARELRRRCQQLAAGSRLPPERTLAHEFGVSVMTVRQALGQLVDDGWVNRTAGRGTFVTRPTVSMGPTLTSFTVDMRRRGLEPSSTVLRVERVVPDLETVAALGIRPGESTLLVERLRRADGEPICHEVSLFPERVAEQLLAGRLDQSVHEILVASGAEPRSSERSVRAVVAGGRECELLELPPGSPALEIIDLFSDVTGRPVQHARTRYRFDRYEVRSLIETNPRPAGAAI